MRSVNFLSFCRSVRAKACISNLIQSPLDGEFSDSPGTPIPESWERLLQQGGNRDEVNPYTGRRLARSPCARCKKARLSTIVKYGPCDTFEGSACYVCNQQGVGYSLSSGIPGPRPRAGGSWPYSFVSLPVLLTFLNIDS